MDTMQIYNQVAWHDPALIVADRESLLKLRAAIDQALEKGVGAATCFASDGEGYQTIVYQMKKEEENKWGELIYPYSMHEAEKYGATLYPQDLLTNDQWKEIYEKS